MTNYTLPGFATLGPFNGLPRWTSAIDPFPRGPYVLVPESFRKKS